MDRIRLLFVAPYEAMVSVIQGILSNRDDIDAEYCDNHDYWENYQGSLSVKYSDTIQKAVNQGFDVILSRFGSAYELRSITNTPIVDISISELDMIKAFRLAQNHGGKAVVVGVNEITACAKKVGDILQYPIDTITVDNPANAYTLIKDAKLNGYTLVIGGTMAVTLARRLNMNSIFLTSSEDVIARAIDEAVEIAKRNREYYQNSLVFNSVLSELCDAAIMYNINGRQILFNSIHSLSDEFLFSIIDESAYAEPEDYRFKKHLGKLGIDLEVIVKSICFNSTNGYIAMFIRHDLCFDLTKEYITLRNVNDITDFSYSNSLHGNYIDAIRTSILLPGNAMSPVLIMGESGTGKTSMALDLYRTSDWSKNPIAIINCSIISEKRWGDILRDDQSIFTLSNYTFFFKNIQDIPLNSQKNLVSYLSLSNTHKRNHIIFTYSTGIDDSLPPLVGYLKYELCCITADLPSLNNRSDEMERIVSLCINDLNATVVNNVVGFSSEAIDELTRHKWKYNIRELQQTIRSIVLSSENTYIQKEEVQKFFIGNENVSLGAENNFSITGTLDDLERKIILQVLNDEGQNQSKAAERLGISRSTLWRKLKL